MRIYPIALALCLAAPSFALPPDKPMRGPGAAGGDAKSPAPAPVKELKNPSIGVDYKVTFSLKNGTRAESGSFILGEGAQSNYVAGGEQPWETATDKGATVDLKKSGLIINGLVHAAGAGAVDAEFQFEMTGPQAPDPASKLKVPSTSTFQYQVSFRAPLSKPFVLLEQPDRRIEVVFERIEP